MSGRDITGTKKDVPRVASSGMGALLPPPPPLLLLLVVLRTGANDD